MGRRPPTNISLLHSYTYQPEDQRIEEMRDEDSGSKRCTTATPPHREMMSPSSKTIKGKGNPSPNDPPLPLLFTSSLTLTLPSFPYYFQHQHCHRSYNVPHCLHVVSNIFPLFRNIVSFCFIDCLIVPSFCFFSLLVYCCINCYYFTHC